MKFYKISMLIGYLVLVYEALCGNVAAMIGAAFISIGIVHEILQYKQR